MRNDSGIGVRQGYSVTNSDKSRKPSLFTFFASVSLNTVLFLGWNGVILSENFPKILPSNLSQLTAQGKNNSANLQVIQSNIWLNLGNKSAEAADSNQVKGGDLPGRGGAVSSPELTTVESNRLLSSEKANTDLNRSYPQTISNIQPAFTLSLPLAEPAEITSEFGWRTHPIFGNLNFHQGIDFAAVEGTPVLAVHSGQVAIADWNGGYGLTVVLEHDSGSSETLYAHLSQILVQPGEIVQVGQVIGLVGSTGYSTGPHLHFEYRELTDRGWISVDPSSLLDNPTTGFNFAQEAEVTETILVANSEPTLVSKLVSDRASELAAKNDPVAKINVSSVNASSQKSETSLPATAEFDLWVTELKQEFTNLKPKTLTSSNDYPETACAEKLEGTVVIGAFVNAWGQIIRTPKVLQPSQQQILNQAALNYIQNFNLPETGQPTAYQYVFQFKYDQKMCNRQVNPQ